MFAAPAFAHTATVTTDKGSYLSGDTIRVSGSVSPTPAPTGTSAFIQLLNPAGTQVAASPAPVDSSSGSFSATFVAGGTAQWTTGTYRVTATYAHDLAETPFTATATFLFTAAAAPAAAPQLLMSIDATTPLVPGQAGGIFALVSWSNGSLAEANFPIAHFHPPTGPAVNLAAPERHHIGLYSFEFPAQTAAGAYGVHIQANASNVKVQGLTVITVSDQLASASAVAGLSTDLGALKSSVTADLTTLKSDVAGAKASADAAKSSVDTLKTDVANLGSSVGNVSTFVLVVAALAAITLVLEIAILIRRART